MSRSVYIIAGETSGDVLGARLMSALADMGDFSFDGIGGTQMTENGLQSLFPMHDLSVMGIFEILPKLPQLMKRINQTVRDITEKQPDIVITVDSPDFCKRVVKKTRGKCPKTRFIHYVAPTVWAWREGRAETMADLFDGLICLLPFEPPYFEKYALKAAFCGHPIVETLPQTNTAERVANNILILPGSRIGEVNKMAPVFASVYRELHAEYPSLHASVVALPHVREHIERHFSGLDITYIAPNLRFEAFQHAGFAMATSGTVGLELAVAQCPHIVAYKMNPVTFLLAKWLVKTPYAHLVNIMEGKEIIPEFIQHNCTADNILHGLNDLQKQNLQSVRAKLCGADINTAPSVQAAKFVTEFL